MKLFFTLDVVPRTKKTHNRVFGFGKQCPYCGRHEHSKVLPSEQYEAMLKTCLFFANGIKQAIIKQRPDLKLPIVDPVWARVHVFRERNDGDRLGYWQAVSDIIQEERWNCTACRKTVGATDNCACGAAWSQRRQTRLGMGIIRDDKQIVSWNDSDLFVDKKNPRVEVTLIVQGPPLLAEVEE